MNHDKRLIFSMDVYLPETIPMAKLAEYMADFAALLGMDNAVYFDRLTKGSTNVVARVEFQDLPKVTTRLQEIRRGNPPKGAEKIFEQIDSRLANDNAVGRVLIEGQDGAALAELLTFPGRSRPPAQSHGPFNQEGHLDGILIAVGGKDDLIRLRLQNGEQMYSSCETIRAIARELGKHLFEPIRIHGSGRWLREADGTWTLIRFRVHRFEVLGTTSLRDTVTALRAAHGSSWKELDDPLAELADMRRDEDELH